MTQYFQIHPDDPQKRLIDRAAGIVRDGGVIVYPTDSSYALGCHLGNKSAMERIRRIRGAHNDHYFTLVCRDLSEISTYAKIDNPAYRLIRSLTPGPYTFILRATREVPSRLQHPRRKTIGIRVPSHAVPRLLIEALGEPLMSTTLQLPEDDYVMSDAVEIRERLGNRVDLVIDGGSCTLEQTSVIDLSGEAAEVLRRGLGDVSVLER